jgi:hypothetical protein
LGWLHSAHNWLKLRQPQSRKQFAAGAVRAISYQTMRSILSRNGFKIVNYSGLGSPRAMYYRVLVQVFSQFGNTDNRLRYEYRYASSFWEPSPFWSYFANVNFIIATKEKQDG